MFLLLLLIYFTLFSSVSIVDLDYVNVSWVKTIQKKKSYYEINLRADVRGCSLKQVLRKIPQKLKDTTAPESLFNNTAGSH